MRRFFGWLLLCTWLAASAFGSSATSSAALPAGGSTTIVRVRLETTTLGGAPITQVSVGSRFLLRAYVSDVRPSPQGVYAAYMDVSFPTRVSASGSIVHGASYPNNRSGSTSTPGLFDEVGAAAGFTALGAGEFLLFSVELNADTEGPALFESSFADNLPASSILVFGRSDAITDVEFGSTSLTVTGASSPTEASFIPKKVSVKLDLDDPTRSKLAASGTFDTGALEVDLAGAAALDVAGLSFALPGMTRQKNGSYLHATENLSFSVVPSKIGSSRASFKLSVAGDFAGRVDPDGSFALRYVGNGIDAQGTVVLVGGQFALGKVRGALTRPTLFLSSVKATLVGGGNDALKLKVGLSGLGATPTSAPEVTVSFGPSFTQVLPGAQFVPKGEAFVFTGTAPGITSLTLDYAKETLSFAATGIALGALPQGAQPVRVTIVAGTTHSAEVRMVRSGSSLKY